jgi:hypothetical protein
MGRFTGMVFERNFYYTKKLFRKKFAIKMEEVCGYETEDEITSKNRYTKLLTLNSEKEAKLFKNSITKLENSKEYHSIDKLIEDTKLELSNI